MKNNEKKKSCKDCNCTEVVEKKVKTMEDGKKYYEKVEEKEIDSNKEEQKDSE